MRVVSVNADRGIPVFGDKGAAVHVREMLRAFGTIGCEVRLLAAKLGEGNPDDLDGLVEVVPGPLRSATEKGLRAEKERRYMAVADAVEERLVGLHADWPFDLIYERYSLWSAAGVRAGERLGVPTIIEVNAPLVTEQAAWRKLSLTAEAEAVEAEVLAGADAIAAVSAQVADYAVSRGARRERVHVFPNAVNLARFHPAVPAAETGFGQEAFVIGFTGSLKSWHGAEVLLEAFRAVHARLPEARLMIVGDGPRRTWIDGFLAGAGLTGAALCTGWVEHDRLPGLIAAMDVTTAPYPPSEAFYFSPLKLCEYLAMGRPVVASRIGQVAEAVEDGASGLLVAPGDADALAAALIRLRTETGLARRLAEGAAARGARYSWTGTAQAVVDLGQQLRRAA